jgi:hypothetical protein
MKSDPKIGAACGLWFSDNPQDRHFWEIRSIEVSGVNFLREGVKEPLVAFYVAVKAKDPIIIPFRFLTLFFTILGYVGSGSELLYKMEKDPDFSARAAKWKRKRRL